MSAASTRFVYSRETLLRLRPHAAPLSRLVRRRLWFHRIRRSPHVNHYTEAASPCLLAPFMSQAPRPRNGDFPAPNFPRHSPLTFSFDHSPMLQPHNIQVLQHLITASPIPVRITRRHGDGISSRHGRNPHRNSIQKNLITIPRGPRSQHNTQDMYNNSLEKKPTKIHFHSSVLLSNVRSLNNKYDEIAMKMNDLLPNVAFFTESWLDSDIPNTSLEISGYSIVRKDRNRNGGGIMSYIDDNLRYRFISHDDVPILNQCATEFLPLLFCNVSLLIICLYHPFWNDTPRDDECIECITDIMDYANLHVSNSSEKLRIILCGDFNGLRHNYNKVECTTLLKPVVCSPTRNDNILDQIFVNFCSDTKASVLPPIGKSD